MNLEREACEDFLFAVTDDLLTPWQEATCEVFSYPWHLDMLAICNVLAAQHNQSTVRSPAFNPHASGQPKAQAHIFSLCCCAKIAYSQWKNVRLGLCGWKCFQTFFLTSADHADLTYVMH